METRSQAVSDRSYDRKMAGKSLSEACREKGLRMTRQRQVIVDLLENSREHLDAPTLLREARRRVPAIDKTTVYRTIKRLRKLGLIDELDLLHMGEHDGHFYEPLPEKMHLHIVCMQCGKVEDMQPETWAEMEREVETKRGYSIEMARVEIGGYCPACRRARSGG
ncbi:MAG: transcriptional repressor [Armatimonadota bacterium]|nr:MAG: transcriptional repressor [Armatimonadota bacterium]